MKKWLPIFLFMALLAGCVEKTGPQTTRSEPIYSKQYRQHAATAIVTLSETNIPTSGKIQLMIDVHAPAGAEVQLPDPGNRIEPFSVADSYTEPRQSLPNGKQLHRQVWQLTPGLSGDHVFQPLEIRAGRETILTEPVHIRVESMLPSDIDVLEIKDITEPISLLPETQQKEQRLEILMGLIASLLLLICLILLGRRKRRPAPALSPYETALLALNNLPADELERIQTLHAILIRFIETGLAIPMAGKTVDEIISKLPRPILLGQRHLLETFLKTSEQARFSHQIPPDFTSEFEQFIQAFIRKNTKGVACD